MSKSDKARELGLERASNRILKYLDKLRWRKHGIEDFNMKVFNQTNKRNTKAYFAEVSQMYEKLFRITLDKYTETISSYGNEERELFDSLKQAIRDLTYTITEEKQNEEK